MKKPPHLAECFLRWYCHPEWLEEIEGDLQTLFHRRVEKYGYRRAQLLYWLNVLMFLHPNFIRRKKFYPQNTTHMFRNYFTVAFRNLTKHKSFSVINIAGLTLGITTALIILLIVRFELSFDTFHTKADRIYRVLSGKPGDLYDTGTPHGLMQILQEEFAEVEKVSAIYKPNAEKTQVEVNQALVRIPETYFVTSTFFEMFDFDWVVGNPQKSLSQPNQVVIDEALAEKFFQGDALGKRIRLNNRYDLVISGIIKKVPDNTDFPIRMAVSHATFAHDEQYQAAYKVSRGSSYHTYILLREAVDPTSLEAKFPGIVAKYLGKEIADKYIAHGLQPLSDIHFNEKTGRGNFSTRAASKESLWSIFLIGCFILLMASINFVNLATAQAVKRSKEVGIRKVLGSSRIQLFIQFIGEACFITLIATIISIVLASLFLPQLQLFLDIPVDEHGIFQLEVLAWLTILCIVITLLAGFYPAMVLSNFQPVFIIKNSFTYRPIGGLLLRKSLVIFQFVITQVLIIGTIVVASQNNYFRTKPLGFDKEAVVTVDIPDNDPQAMENIRNSLSQYPQIKNISFSLNAPAATSDKWFNAFVHRSDPDEFKSVELKPVDQYYMDLYDIPLLAGEPLDENDNYSNILVNESFVKEIDIDNPQEAVGETIDIGGQSVTIQGVVQDFHSLSLHEDIYPLALVRAEDRFQLASFKIDMTRAQEAIGNIEQQWKEAFPQHYFTYKFLDEDLNIWYKQERKTSRLLSVFSFIAIFIGCLGLYGLVSFMTTQKVKEIGIRKVLGASVQQIVYLFTKDFMVLIAVAFTIAAPIGYYLMQLWLQDFTYKIEISWWIFVVAALAGLLIAGFTVSFKSIRAALANPVDALRNE